ncbi:anthranilate/para-aminobenzoate synthase component I [Caldisphaera lagunensis DSM 15908]|uniref:anthranilate synthase n=1 Tax=Caldisphaera lagunensis (strain DSM 15908 / JCM 11604 / ANMR 0165 / IC-154) TaxID=1056495 RepID=L0A8Z0_CALLD|nr:anthranilate synthase component I [Caldisphaera lagunensis]AFZ69889.1 anthranilate/para-aminobenzoate synthase component I [Caldisphaera lagunensis DSM 15908]
MNYKSLENMMRFINNENDFFAILEDSNKREIRIYYGKKSYFIGNDKNFLNNLEEFNRGNEYAIGYISYDSVKLWEKVKDINEEAEKWPYAEFFIPENQIIINDINNEFRKEINSENVSTKFYDQSLDKELYEQGVRKILDYIHKGYAFQVVLSRFYRYLLHGDPIEIYIKLRKISPSPYNFYIKFHDRILIGSSPELLFKYDNNVKTYPIAGTRPRGKSEEEDKKLEFELLNSEKDRAEHLMLLDLARNDLGKISIPGSVEVLKSFYIEKYSHVQHIVSEVVGKLDKRKGLKDIIKAMFPAGTVSGAPKVFAMNLIEDLERYKRGPYAGIVGYYNKNEGEFAITIRTALINKEIMRIQAGAGIVYDSIPENEFFETEYKLMALKEAIGDK